MNLDVRQKGTTGLGVFVRRGGCLTGMGQKHYVVYTLCLSPVLHTVYDQSACVVVTICRSILFICTFLKNVLIQVRVTSHHDVFECISSCNILHPKVFFHDIASR